MTMEERGEAEWLPAAGDASARSQSEGRPCVRWRHVEGSMSLGDENET
jgi:hypothetical protein